MVHVLMRRMDGTAVVLWLYQYWNSGSLIRKFDEWYKDDVDRDRESVAVNNKPYM